MSSLYIDADTPLQWTDASFFQEGRPVSNFAKIIDAYTCSCTHLHNACADMKFLGQRADANDSQGGSTLGVDPPPGSIDLQISTTW